MIKFKTTADWTEQEREQLYNEIRTINIPVGRCDQHAFNFACQVGNLEMAKFLYESGTINKRQSYIYAFKWASINGHTDIVNWLCSIANPNSYEGEKVALEWSFFKGYKEIAQLIISRGGINNADSSIYTQMPFGA